MADCIAIAPELPFQQQVIEFATHLSRSIPSTSDSNAPREYVSSVESQVKDAGEDVPLDTKKSVVKGLVSKLGEVRGGLEAAKEAEPESAHLLLQHLLSTTFDGEEYEAQYRAVVDAVQKGGEANATASRFTRVEAACRILNNAYNFLPPSSPLRPTTLLAILSLLHKLNEISSLPLTPAYLSASLAQWDLPTKEKINFLTRASAIYQSAGDLSKAVDVLVLALQQEAVAETAEKAIILALAREDSFDLDEVLSIRGVKELVGGKLGEAVRLFTEKDELEAVKEGSSWVKANEAWIKEQAVPQFTADGLLRKLRLIALVTLCARATSKQLSYQEVATALDVDVSEVEEWVIDALSADLLTARLSQPSSLIRIQSVSKAGTRRFGSDEWQLLERRLVDWQRAVNDARKAVEEASEVAAQGPQTHQRRPQQQQQQQQPREEVAA